MGKKAAKQVSNHYDKTRSVWISMNNVRINRNNYHVKSSTVYLTASHILLGCLCQNLTKSYEKSQQMRNCLTCIIICNYKFKAPSGCTQMIGSSREIVKKPHYFVSY